MSDQSAPAPDFPYYQAYELDEDTKRSQVHYEQPVGFFYPILGGEWQSYSSWLWPEGVETETAAQEAKLDLLARLMDLQPGQRIMDVGCGWGGPLVYLCKTYNVRGVGLTVSPMQRVAIAAGFEVIEVYQIPVAPHYLKTLDRWLTNMHDHRRELEAVVGPEIYRAYRRYFNVVRSIFLGRVMTLNVVVSQKLARTSE